MVIVTEPVQPAALAVPHTEFVALFSLCANVNSNCVVPRETVAVEAVALVTTGGGGDGDGDSDSA